MAVKFLSLLVGPSTHKIQREISTARAAGAWSDKSTKQRIQTVYDSLGGDPWLDFRGIFSSAKKYTIRTVLKKELSDEQFKLNKDLSKEIETNKDKTTENIINLLKNNPKFFAFTPKKLDRFVRESKLNDKELEAIKSLQAIDLPLLVQAYERGIGLSNFKETPKMVEQAIKLLDNPEHRKYLETYHPSLTEALKQIQHIQAKFKKADESFSVLDALKRLAPYHFPSFDKELIKSFQTNDFKIFEQLFAQKNIDVETIKTAIRAARVFYQTHPDYVKDKCPSLATALDAIPCTIPSLTYLIPDLQSALASFDVKTPQNQLVAALQADPRFNLFFPYELHLIAFLHRKGIPLDAQTNDWDELKQSYWSEALWETQQSKLLPFLSMDAQALKGLLEKLSDPDYPEASKAFVFGSALQLWLQPELTACMAPPLQRFFINVASLPAFKARFQTVTENLDPVNKQASENTEQMIENSQNNSLKLKPVSMIDQRTQQESSIDLLSAIHNDQFPGYLTTTFYRDNGTRATIIHKQGTNWIASFAKEIKLLQDKHNDPQFNLLLQQCFVQYAWTPIQTQWSTNLQEQFNGNLLTFGKDSHNILDIDIQQEGEALLIIYSYTTPLALLDASNQTIGDRATFRFAYAIHKDNNQQWAMSSACERLAFSF